MSVGLLSVISIRIRQCSLDRRLSLALAASDIDKVRSALNLGADARCSINTHVTSGLVDLIKLELNRNHGVAKSRSNEPPLIFVLGPDHKGIHARSSVKDVTIAMLLIQHGADPNSSDQFGRTALRFSIGRRETGLAQALLDRGANVNAADDNGVAPLACAHSMRDAALLLNHGADALHESKTGETALCAAIWDLDVDRSRLLLEAERGYRDPYKGNLFSAVAAGLYKQLDIHWSLAKSSPVITSINEDAIKISRLLIAAGYLFPDDKPGYSAIEANLKENGITVDDRAGIFLQYSKSHIRNANSADSSDR